MVDVDEVIARRLAEADIPLEDGQDAVRWLRDGWRNGFDFVDDDGICRRNLQLERKQAALFQFQWAPAGCSLGLVAIPGTTEQWQKLLLLKRAGIFPLLGILFDQQDFDRYEYREGYDYGITSDDSY